MQIVKTHHESGQGIYGNSRAVVSKEDWKEAKAIANEMTAWLDETNGNFKGEFSRAFAIAHAQVCDWLEPWKLFVVAKEMVNEKPSEKTEDGKRNPQTLANYYFEGQAIFNAEILESPAKITRKVPERKVLKDEKDPTKVSVSVELVDKEISNIITVPEGCMSFSHRSEKNVERLYKVKVRYQYLHKGILGTSVKTFEGWVEGLKAHMFQHECDHFVGKNIYFNN